MLRLLALSLATTHVESLAARAPAVPHIAAAHAPAAPLRHASRTSSVVMHEKELLSQAPLKQAPGLALAYGISVFATDLAARTQLSPLLWAAVVGMGAGAIVPALASGVPKPGVAFAKARLLRLGIILYGVKLTVQQIAGIGAAGLLADLFAVGTALPLGIALGRALKVDAPLAALISTGAAICGCSAVAAAAPVVEGEAHEVAASVGTVVLCGTCAMFLYPYLYHAVPFLAANPRLMGIYTGASVHEV